VTFVPDIATTELNGTDIEFTLTEKAEGDGDMDARFRLNVISSFVGAALATAELT
jgi:hypothetical protein